ncbi:hypothetical protein [Pedobacter jeongneungensis]|uniref:hypothetical protein n=1 Tax=Pedobacter jeongneungensis TaxID=947309 RepID=UPI00046920A0|nr:hypothetical protein [Pedobacter jeongneungensis]
MRKLILIGLVAIMAMGCKSRSYQESSITIGMPENEFKRVNRSAELMLASDDGTNIYRSISTTFIPKPEPYTFFYFYQGKLSRFVKSDRIDDYKFIR